MANETRKNDEAITQLIRAYGSAFGIGHLEGAPAENDEYSLQNCVIKNFLEQPVDPTWPKNLQRSVRKEKKDWEKVIFKPSALDRKKELIKRMQLHPKFRKYSSKELEDFSLFELEEIVKSLQKIR